MSVSRSGTFKPRVLFVGRGAPWRGGAGYLVRQKMFLEALTGFAQVTVAMFDLCPKHAEAGVMDLGLEQVVAIPEPTLVRESRWKMLWNDLARSTPRMMRGRDLSKARAVVAALRPDEFDAVVVYRIDTAVWSGLIERPDLLLDIDDPEHARTARRLEKLGLTPDRRTRADLRKLKDFEQHAAAMARVAFVCQEADAARFDPPRPEVAPNAVDTPDALPAMVPGRADRDALLFVGNLDADLENPNVEGLLWFVDQVWPLVRAQRPATRLQIGGKTSAVVAGRLEGVEGLDLLGFVDDMAATVRRAAVNLAPIRFGTGTRIKVLDALAQGGAVVSTTLGCEGIDVVDGRHVRLADGPSAFAAACVELLEDPAAAAALGRAGHALMRERYSTAVHVPRLAARLSELVGPGRIDAESRVARKPTPRLTDAKSMSEPDRGQPPMRITILSPPPDLSGGQRVVAIYTQQLIAWGHQVGIVCVRPIQHTMVDKLRAVRRGRGWPKRRTIGESHFERLGVPYRVVDHRGPLTDADLPDADVCVATWWSTSLWLRDLSPSKGGKAYFMQDYGAPGQEWHKVEPTWSLPAKIITISHWLHDRIRRVEPRADVTLAPNGVELEKFTMKRREVNRPIVCGVFYRHLETKRSRMALEAFARFHADGGEGILRVIGHDEPPEEFADAPWLDALGPIGDEQLVEVYQSCDAWLFTSESEGFGLPILEAMACGTPVIASTAGAAPELVPGGGGWLIEDFSAASLADAIRELSQIEPADWAERSMQARAVAERYDWSAATRLFMASLRDAAASNGHPTASTAGPAGRDAADPSPQPRKRPA